MSVRFSVVILRAPALLALGCMLLPCAGFAGKKKKNESPSPPPVKASLPPSATIPISQLGFAPPGALYLGSRQALVSLDFLDEDRLLFTFRVPGLIHRDPHGDPSETERHIRAVVLHIPDGAVQAQDMWTLHDRSRYLSVLDNGEFVVRDRNNLLRGNASLQLTPWLRFPGPVLWVEFDATGKYLVSISEEPAAAPEAGSGQASNQASGQGGSSPATANASMSDNAGSVPEPRADYVLRLLSRATGKVMLLSRVRSLIHLPFNNEGYIEPLRSNGAQWLLNMDYFTGGTSRIGFIDSYCVPTLNFLSAGEFLATVCNNSDTRAIVALTSDGRTLWHKSQENTATWPLYAFSRGGTRFAREVLAADHMISAFSPLNTDDIKHQEVAVFDAATGKQVLDAQPSPILDGGGNVALSPSGRRAAVLMDGNIQIFELGEPPAAP